MTFQQYLDNFEDILNSSTPPAPYNDEHFFNYAKLNWSRMHRWLKKRSILPEVKEAFERELPKQKWILISEPWCGDAAHIVPFIHLLAELNPAIELDIELRDSEPFRIENYLTNGGKSIPILIIQDEDGNDVSVWGPRPAGAQALQMEMKAKNTPVDEAKIELQNWYNHNNGVAIQEELSQLVLEQVA